MMDTDTTDILNVPGTSFSIESVTVEQGVHLRILMWSSPEIKDMAPLVFVPGFVSILEGWVELLREVVKKRPVFYIESREKNSTRIERDNVTPSDFAITRLGLDIISVCHKLDIDIPSSFFAGSSLGATSLIEALKQNDFQPKGVMLIGPNTEFKGPWFVRSLLMLHPLCYHIVKYFIIWYLKVFRVDARHEPEQMERYRKTLLDANPYRLRLAAKAVLSYQAWPNLEKIYVPVGIAFAPSDTLHTEENIHRLNKTLPISSLIQCESNKYMHTKQFNIELEHFLSNL